MGIFGLALGCQTDQSCNWSQSRHRPQSQSLRIPFPHHYKEAWALIRDRSLFLGCFLGERAGRSGAAAHLINADSAGHTVASNSSLPVAL